MQKAEVVNQVMDMTVKATPPVTVTGLTICGVTLPEVVSVLTIVYLLIHIGYIIKKWKKGE